MPKKVFIRIVVVIVVFTAILAVASFIFAPHAAAPGTPPAPTADEGILTGSVLLGPTCPVEQNPPLPGCAPRPYATTVFVFTAANTAAPYASLPTDASGKFSVALHSGAYVVQAKSGGTNGMGLPRCGSVDVTVSAGATATTTLNCNTGIR